MRLVDINNSRLINMSGRVTGTYTEDKSTVRGPCRDLETLPSITAYVAELSAAS